jgi:DNA-directed RNA polymerase specialized sigma24 family protein
MIGWHDGPRGRAHDDDAALRAAQLGDPDTFVQIIASYDALVFRLAWNFTQSLSAATEIYEAVFTTAYRLLPSYTSGDSFLIWIFRIATRCSLAYVSGPTASRRVRAWWPGDDTGLGPNGMGAAGLGPAGLGPDAARIPVRLRQALMQLDRRDRLVFILRHELQFKTATIARMIDAPEHSVQTSLTRAFLMLRNAARAIGTRQ